MSVGLPKVRSPKVLLDDDYQVLDTTESSYSDSDEDAEFGGVPVQQGVTRKEVERISYRRWAEWAAAFVAGSVLTAVFVSSSVSSQQSVVRTEVVRTYSASGAGPTTPAAPIEMEPTTLAFATTTSSLVTSAKPAAVDATTPQVHTSTSSLATPVTSVAVKPTTTTQATTTTTSTTTATTTKPLGGLSMQERQKFIVPAKDHNLIDLQHPKPTPTGWWPDAEWVRECVDKPRELTPFETLDEWVDYRLGDCIKLCGGCPTTEDHPELAHWTIAGQYYDLACDPQGPQYHQKRGNETLLDEILDAVQIENGFTKPDPEAIVIHLRLGDKIEDSNADVYDMLQNSADPGHRSFAGEHAIKSVYEFLTNIVTSEAPKVVIRGGSQLPMKYKKSKTYAYCLQEAIAEAGFDVSINLDEGNADRDFYYMVHAKKMILSVGGFSRYIGHMVLRKGGIVYGRMFR